MRRSGPTTILWMGGLYFGAAALTAAAFFSFIIPEYRGTTFYHVLGSSLVAELVFFAYLAYAMIAGPAPGEPSPGMRLRIMVLVIFGLLVILVSGAVAIAPTQADTFYSDKILLWQMLFVFALFVGAYLLNRQDMVLQQGRAEPERGRLQLQSYAMGVDALLTSVRELIARRPTSAVELEKLVKRLDTLKTQLLANSPLSSRMPERGAGPTLTEWIVQQLRDVHEQVHRLAEADEAGFLGQLTRTHEGVDAVIAALRHRENAVSF